MKYPVIMISKADGSIVRFTSESTGAYLKSNVSKIYGERYKTGTIHDDFIPCTQPEQWRMLIEVEEITLTGCVSGRGDGDKTSYYDLPENATQLKDLIKHKKMEHGVGEAFCALYRLNDNGEYKRNLTKAKFYIEEELKWLEKQANQ